MKNEELWRSHVSNEEVILHFAASGGYSSFFI